MTIDRRRIVIGGALIALSGPARAHHGFTGRYDTDQPIWLKGRITALTLARPHPTITLTPVDEPVPHGLKMPPEMTGALVSPRDRVGVAQTVEFAPVSAFFDMGDRARVGDVVEIIALRNCSPPHQLRSQWLRLANGAVIERVGKLSYMHRGCAT
jgi:hypothetical protein